MTFKDKAGNSWSLALSVGAVRRVRDATGVDLGAVNERLFTDLAGDWCKLVDVLCAIVRPQLTEAGVSDEDFAEALGGDELAAAVDALLEALVSFSHPKKRAILSRAIDKANEMQAAIVARATARLETMTVDDLAGSGERSLEPPESSESIPIPGHSATC